MLSNHNLKKIITKYLIRLSFFFVFYHGLVRPLQVIVNSKIVKPSIEHTLNNEKKYELKLDKHHTSIYLKENESHMLRFSIPFGQLYFFLLFFLWFKPKTLIKSITIYNLAIIPFYTLAIILFFDEYTFWGELIIINEKVYRLTYTLIIILKIFRPNQLYLIFDNLKED